MDEIKHRLKSEFSEWRSEHVVARDTLEVPVAEAPWSQRNGIALQGLPNSMRMKDNIDLCMLNYLKKNPKMSIEEAAQKLWCNPSQSAGRFPCAEDPGTLITSSLAYSYRHDAVLSGEGHLRVLGRPEWQCPGELFTEHQLRHLAGEACSSVCMGIVLTAYYANPWAPWWPKM